MTYNPGLPALHLLTVPCSKSRVYFPPTFSSLPVASLPLRIFRDWFLVARQEKRRVKRCHTTLLCSYERGPCGNRDKSCGSIPFSLLRATELQRMTLESVALRRKRDAALRQCKHHFPIQRFPFSSAPGQLSLGVPLQTGTLPVQLPSERQTRCSEPPERK